MQTLDRCPICRSAEIRPAFKSQATRDELRDGKVWAVWSCADCGHGFLNPQPSWEELAPYYDAGYTPYEPDHGAPDSFEAEAARARASGEFRHIPISAGLRVLDVGCGGGHFLRVVTALGAEAEGVEPSAAGVRTARGLGLDVFHGTLEDYAAHHPGERFDVVTACHVVEHLPDPVQTLRVMGSLLRPGGYVWTVVPNVASWFARRSPGRWHSWDLPYHLMHFTPGSMARATAEAGLRVRRQYTTTHPPACAESLYHYLRERCLVPYRLASRLPLLGGRLARWLSRRMDRRGTGEAIITECTA